MGHPAATPVTAGFLNVFNVFMAGGLVPLIVRPLSPPDSMTVTTLSSIAGHGVQAIYPASIIVLVALNRSHVEKGLTQNPRDITVPTPHVSAILARVRDGAGDGSRWRVIVSEEDKFEPGENSEGASARTSTSGDEERKVGETV